MLMARASLTTNVLVKSMDFKRPQGLVGKLPKEWVDKNLPKCPFCKESVLWELAIEKEEKSSFERVFGQIPQRWFKAYHFRYPKCRAVLSVPSNAVVDIPIAHDGSTFPGLVKLAKQIEYKRDEKLWDGKMHIESVGTSSSLQDALGTEIPLKTLQEWASKSKDSK
jgi:hypothetical protein